jgi:crotonyl-CoA carboxylase/reductase
MLLGWPPHTVKPGDPVLVWGGSGGLGSMAIQLTRHFGGRAIAVVSDESKRDFCMKLGAVGVINRREFSHWGRLPDWRTEASTRSRARARFGEDLGHPGERRSPRIVFEHPGEATIPTSIFMADNAGMVVICAGTSGYNADVDLRYLWMRQKRLQGSHFANTEQCAAFNQLVMAGKVDPCLSEVYQFDQVGESHQAMFENRHRPATWRSERASHRHDRAL